MNRKNRRAARKNIPPKNREAVETLVILGGECLRNGRAERAEVYFSQALQNDSRHAGALLGWGKTLLQTERPRDALRQLRKSATHGPATAELHDLMADALMLLGRQEEAETHRRKARFLAGDGDDAHTRGHTGTDTLADGMIT